MKALIIVDMQYDFMEGGALEVADANALLPKINALQKDYDLVVASQDWHPPTHSSFASQHKDSKIFDTINVNGIQQVLWPDHCVQETQGARLHEDLSTAKIEAIFRKGMDENIDSYSAFFDNGKQKSTGLADYLKGRGVTEVAVCGLAADYCVYYTAKDALELGFAASIIESGTKAIDLENFEKIKNDFVAMGGKIIA